MPVVVEYPKLLGILIFCQRKKKIEPFNSLVLKRLISALLAIDYRIEVYLTTNLGHSSLTCSVWVENIGIFGLNICCTQTVHFRSNPLSEVNIQCNIRLSRFCLYVWVGSGKLTFDRKITILSQSENDTVWFCDAWVFGSRHPNCQNPDNALGRSRRINAWQRGSPGPCGLLLWALHFTFLSKGSFFNTTSNARASKLTRLIQNFALFFTAIFGKFY